MFDLIFFLNFFSGRSIISSQISFHVLGVTKGRNQDSTQHRQTLSGAGLRHAWTTPIGYKVPDWSGVSASEVRLTILGACCWDWASGIS